MNNIIKKQIVFMETSPTDMLAKIAYLLRKKGYETILISITGDLEKSFLKKSYDQRICFNFKYIKVNFKNLPKIIYYLIKNLPTIINSFIKTNKLKPYIFLARSNPSWLCVFFKSIFKNYPFIYFPYDIRSSTYKDLKEIKQAGVPNFEIRAERHCFKNSDGVLHKGNPNELKSLNKNILGQDVKVKCPEIYFFPYCLKELMVPINSKDKLSKKDDQHHIVFTGNMGNSSEWLELMNLITKQKIHLHIYGKTSNLSEKEDYARIKQYYNQLLDNPFFHLHNPVPQEKLSKEISKYDFGVFSFDMKNKGDKISTGNKISTYLEAGIPIICLSNFETLSDLIKKYKIGLAIDFKDFSKLNKILKQNPYNEFVKNIPKAKKELSMRKHIPRLERFFKEVVDYSFSNK